MGIDHLCVGCCAPAGSAGQASTLQYGLHLRGAVSHLMHLHSNLHNSRLASAFNIWQYFGLQALMKTCLLDVVPVCVTNPQQDLDLCALSINLQSSRSRREAMQPSACTTTEACGAAYLQKVDVMESLLLHHMAQRLQLAVKQLGRLKTGCFHTVGLQLPLLQWMSCGVAWHCRVESELLLAACLSAKSQRKHCDLHSTQQPERGCQPGAIRLTAESNVGHSRHKQALQKGMAAYLMIELVADNVGLQAVQVWRKRLHSPHLALGPCHCCAAEY